MQAMKIIVLSCFILLFRVGNSEAQNLMLRDSSGNTIANGDTLLISGSTNDFILSAMVQVYNPASIAKYVLVEKTNLQLLSGTQTYFSFGINMYDTSSVISVGPLPIPGAVTETSFLGTCLFTGIAGSSFVRYNFYDTTNTSDSAWLIIEYRIQQTTDIVGEKAVNNLNIYPNPTEGTISIDIDGNINSIDVFSYDGKLIRMGIKSKLVNLKEEGVLVGPLILKISLNDAIVHRMLLLK
jgi:hypothetical protein